MSCYSVNRRKASSSPANQSPPLKFNVVICRSHSLPHTVCSTAFDLFQAQKKLSWRRCYYDYYDVRAGWFSTQVPMTRRFTLPLVRLTSTSICKWQDRQNVSERKRGLRTEEILQAGCTHRWGEIQRFHTDQREGPRGTEVYHHNPIWTFNSAQLPSQMLLKRKLDYISGTMTWRYHTFDTSAEKKTHTNSSFNLENYKPCVMIYLQ